MNQSNDQSHLEEDYAFRNILKSRIDDLNYLWQNKFKVLIFGVLGCLTGIVLAWKWPVTYTARTTFVVEESKGSGGGIMSSLAGTIGLDIGSLMGSSSGVLAGDNVQQLLISQRLLRETLLSPFTDSTESIADKYVKVYKLDKKWDKYTKEAPLAFPVGHVKFTRLQDSLLNEILKTISEKQISVNKPDKKLGFFALNTTMKNAELAAKFNENLIQIAADFYIQTKTQRLRNNVNKLQHRADSLERILNRKTYASSASSSTLLDLNPAYATANVPSELQERDKRLIQTAYGEIVKNLEVSRTMLIQETPTFQIVDTPFLPLRKNRLKYTTAGLGGIVLIGLSGSLWMLSRRKSISK